MNRFKEIRWISKEAYEDLMIFLEQHEKDIESCIEDFELLRLLVEDLEVSPQK